MKKTAIINRLLVGLCLILVLTQHLLYIQYLDSLRYVKGHWNGYLDLAGFYIYGVFLIDLCLWILLGILLILLVIIE